LLYTKFSTWLKDRSDAWLKCFEPLPEVAAYPLSLLNHAALRTVPTFLAQVPSFQLPTGFEFQSPLPVLDLSFGVIPIVPTTIDPNTLFEIDTRFDPTLDINRKVEYSERSQQLGWSRWRFTQAQRKLASKAIPTSSVEDARSKVSYLSYTFSTSSSQLFLASETP